MKFSDRLRASLIHLALCLVIASAAAAVVFLVWYPKPLNTAVGANQFFLLVLAVDIVLGPLLTFVVFNRAKKSLKFDLLIIASMQLAALGYGIHTIYEGKPAYITLNEDRFFLARVNEIESTWYSRPTTHSGFSAIDLYGAPGFAAVKWPTDGKARTDLLFSNSSARVDVYVPIEQAADQIRTVSKPFSDLYKFNKGREHELSSLEAAWKVQGVAMLGFIPLRGDQEDMTVLVDKTSGKVLKIVRLAPWL